MIKTKKKTREQNQYEINCFVLAVRAAKSEDDKKMWKYLDRCIRWNKYSRGYRGGNGNGRK